MTLNNKEQRVEFMAKQLNVVSAANMRKLEEETIKEVARSYKKALKNIKSEIATLYEKYATDGKLTSIELTKFGRFEKMEIEISKYLKELTGETLTITKNSIKEAIKKTYLLNRYVLEQGLGVKTGVYGVNERLIMANILNPMDKIGWESRLKLSVTETLRTVTEAINEGSIQGYAYDKTAKMITDTTDKAFYRAVRIVRTEQHRASNVAAAESFEESKNAADKLGLKIGKIWNAASDEVTRDEHADLDGQIADENGYFHINGLTTEYPGGFGIAAMDINCRCTIANVILEDSTGILDESVVVKPFTKWNDENGKEIIYGR